MASATQQETLPRSLAATVADARGRLAPAQRKVADYFVEAGPATLLMSASEIAEQLAVSDATVVRTAQALGFAGLPELRQALAVVAEEPTLAERLHRTLEHAGDTRDLLADAITGLLTSLDVLVQHVTPAAFARTVDLLAGADVVLWSGIGPSGSLADYACTLTRRMGRRSLALTHSGVGAADDLLEVAPGAVVVVLAYGHVHPHVDALLDRAASCGAPVVLVTDTLHEQLGTRVAESLVTWRGTPGLFSSHATTVVLLEALILGLAGTAPERAEASLAELNVLRSQVR